MTTFQTQLGGRQVIFEPHATVWAEEPGSIGALWKQRLRWARGNVQVTRRFTSVWFRPQPDNRLGSFSFGLIWFCLLLLPVFMLLASASLIILFFIDYQLGLDRLPRAVADQRGHVRLHHVLHAGHRPRHRPAHLEASGPVPGPDQRDHPGRRHPARPGELARPRARRRRRRRGHPGLGPRYRAVHLHLARRPAWAWPSWARSPRSRRLGRFLGPLFVYIGGYGPLLCAITTAAYVKELRHAEATWDKTEKTGKMVVPT